MRRAEAGYFTYQVLARPVGDPCAPWRVVMAGSYAAEGGDRLRGSGELVMDFDLDDAPETAGQALIVWSRDGQTLRVTTSLHAARLAADGCRRSGVYDYKRNHGGAAAGGLLVFRTFADADRLEPAPCVGTSVASPHPSGGVSAVIMARWAAHGGGRADAILPGPELGDEGWAFERRTECWSPEEHLSTFEERVRFGAEQGVVVQHSEGDPTTCRFTTAGEPFLPPLGEAPERMDPMAGFADLQPARECARR